VFHSFCSRCCSMSIDQDNPSRMSLPANGPDDEIKIAKSN
jgi:hypothetical protein